MSTIVIMPGGFHPFHAGHAALYNSVKRAFPDAEVFVAATNDTSTRPFPFAVKEKLAKLAGVEPGHFVQVKSPFRAEEITSRFNPEQDRLIFVRSEKDAGKPPQAGGVKKDGQPAYLQPLLGAKKLEPFARHAYMAYLPTVEFGPGMTSATEIRTAWPQLNEKRKTALVMSLYPKTQTNPRLAATVVKMLDTAIGGQLDEISFFKVPDAPVKKQQEPVGYKHLFKPNEPAPEIPKQYHGWQEYDDENNTSQPPQVKEFAPEIAEDKAGITRRGILKGIAGAAAAGAAGKASGIAGAIPTPSHQQAMYAAVAQSNRAQAAELQRQNNAARAAKLDAATRDIERLNKVNYHGGKVTPTNATWDGDSDFLDLDGTKYNMAARMPIPGDEPSDMKLISTQEGRQVYIWTRRSLKGTHGRYFYPAKGETINEFAPTDNGDNGQEDVFFKYAKLWYNGNLAVQQRIEQILDRAGWEIGELESEEGGAFVVQSGDENGNTYMGWSAEELSDVSENQGFAATLESDGQTAGTPAVGGMWAGYQARENQPIAEDYIDERSNQ